ASLSAASADPEEMGSPVLRLPDGAAVLGVHWRSGFALEGLGELREVRQRAVDPEARGRVRVVDHLHARRFLAVLCAPDLAVGDEELLILREAFGVYVLCSVLAQRTVGPERELEPAHVGDVLTQRELAVD